MIEALTHGVAQRLLRVSLTVPNLDAAERFYREALGFALVSRTATHPAAMADTLGVPGARVGSVLLRLGSQTLELMAFDPPGAPYPADSTSTDLWFQHCAIVVGDMAAAYQHLQGSQATAITHDGPQVLPANTGSVSAFKFRDPFGHPLELIHFPSGTGDPHWAAAEPTALFRGIDHTAISVGDVDQSRLFYARRLGLTIKDVSFNRGREQARLDDVPADDVIVQALSPADAPPHLELLAYRTGRRRPIAPDTRASDIAATRSVFRVGSQDRGPQEPNLLRDPDGHLVILVQDE